MKIAPQHDAKHPVPIHEEYHPRCAWPGNAGVQWGDGRSFSRVTGRVLDTPAFFEAFLKDEKGVWFRGEAPTQTDDEGLAQAEQAAFAKYERYLACEGEHDWVRKFDEYSSVARCSCCGATGSYAVEAQERPVPTDGPLTPHDLSHVAHGLLHAERVAKRDLGDLQGYFDRVDEAIVIRAARQGFELPDPTMDQDRYDDLCEVRVARFWKDNRAVCEAVWNGMSPEEQKASYPPYWSILDISVLDDIAKRRGDEAGPSGVPGMAR